MSPNRNLKNQPPRDWVVYREQGGLDFEGNPCSLFLLFTHVDGSEKYHWNGGRTYTILSKDYEFVKSYGVFSYDSEFEDDIVRKFEEEYRMPKAVDPFKLHDKTAPEGWVSPNGDFYPCGYGGHTAEADYICRLILKETEYYSFGYSHLHEIGWVSLHQGYILNDAAHEKGVKYTEALLSTVLCLLYNAEDANYIQHMQETLFRIEDHVVGNVS